MATANNQKEILVLTFMANAIVSDRGQCVYYNCEG